MHWQLQKIVNLQEPARSSILFALTSVFWQEVRDAIPLVPLATSMLYACSASGVTVELQFWVLEAKLSLNVFFSAFGLVFLVPGNLKWNLCFDLLGVSGPSSKSLGVLACYKIKKILVSYIGKTLENETHNQVKTSLWTYTSIKQYLGLAF